MISKTEVAVEHSVISFVPVLGIVAVYCLVFFVFPPSSLVVGDEASYVGQAVAFSQGHVTFPSHDPFTGAAVAERPSFYPPGTSLLQTPFVRLFGWHYAAIASVLAYVACGCLLAIWLRKNGRAPAFAIPFLGFLPAIALGRIAMSDMPSALVVLWGVMSLWDEDPRPAQALAGGFLWSLSSLFRETNVLVALPFAFTILLRRRGASGWLIAGALAGAGVRLLSSWLFFGHPLFVKAPNQFALSSAPLNLLLYGGSLLLLIPGGLLALATYRGPRRRPLIISVCLYTAVFVFYSYNASESGFPKQLILGPRFLIPIVPLLCMAMAERLPVWAQRFALPRSSHRWLLFALSSLVCLLTTATQVTLSRYSAEGRSIVDAVYAATPPGGVLVADSTQFAKFLSPVYGSRVVLELRATSIKQLRQLVGPNSYLAILELDRADSPYHKLRLQAVREFVDSARARCTIEDAVLSGLHPEARVAVHRVLTCSDYE